MTTFDPMCANCGQGKSKHIPDIAHKIEIGAVVLICPPKPEEVNAA